MTASLAEASSSLNTQTVEALVDAPADVDLSQGQSDQGQLPSPTDVPPCVDRAFTDALARAEGNGYDLRAKVSSGGLDTSVHLQALAPAQALELGKHKVDAQAEVKKGAQAALTQALQSGLITPDAFVSAIAATTA
jgi:hypothetical protein